MVVFSNAIPIVYNKKGYIVIPYKKNGNTYPIVIDRNIWDYIKQDNRHYNMTPNMSLYTKVNGDKPIDIYLHEIVMKINDNNFHINRSKAILHINRINLDNRIDNLTFDKTTKQYTKNLCKKQRLIDLSDDGIDVDKIPSFVWYLNSDDSHGDRFIVELGLIRWKTTSSTQLSLRYKLEEMKKFLRLHIERDPKLLLKYSMNGDLNSKGKNLRKEYFDIIRLAGFNYTYDDDSKTHEFLKQDLRGLNKTEKLLLQEFDLNSNISTNDRLKELI